MTTSIARDVGNRLPSNDLFQTSAGVGHHWRPGYYFPGSEFKSVINDPLPPDLCKKGNVLPDSHYGTTSGIVHDSKYPKLPLNKDYDMKRAPGNWNVHYLKDHKEKLGKGGWRRPLSPSQQKSETIEKFCAEEGIREPTYWGMKPQPFNLQNHHTDGPSKTIIASTTNKKLAGRTLFPVEKEVVRLNDPYLTTNMKIHRRFDPKEVMRYPRKDIATYWDCEQYPKAWGFGLHDCPLPKDTVPRERPPMRDATVFKSATMVRQVPAGLAPVPHSGLKSLYTSSYSTASDVKAKERDFCPVDTPFTLPAPGPKSALAAPAMYHTEYENVGSKKTITV